MILCFIDLLHELLHRFDLVAATDNLSGHRVLRGCWRLWRHGRAWCDTALLPLAMRRQNELAESHLKRSFSGERGIE